MAAYLARKKAVMTAKSIAQRLETWRHMILSNIKFDEFQFKNYLYFEDGDFLEVLRTANFLNDMEREIYHQKRENSSLVFWERPKFTKFSIFYDEATAIQSARGSSKMIREGNTAQEEYIMQNRKNFQDIYIIWADGNQNDKSLRRHVERWFRVKPFSLFGIPLWKLPILRNIWVIERHKKDDEGNILMEKYAAKDERGDYIVKQKPVQENIDWFYKPWVWWYYDDLHKNIKDTEKMNINKSHLKKFVEGNPKLQEKVLDFFPDLFPPTQEPQTKK